MRRSVQAEIFTIPKREAAVLLKEINTAAYYIMALAEYYANIREWF